MTPVAPSAAPFDPKAFGKMTPEEKGTYIASLFKRNLNHGAENAEPTP